MTETRQENLHCDEHQEAKIAGLPGYNGPCRLDRRHL